MSTTEKIIEKAVYKKAMKADCAKWMKLLKKNHVPIMSAHQALEEMHPNTISYVGFYRALQRGGMSYDNYMKAKQVFDALESKLN